MLILKSSSVQNTYINFYFKWSENVLLKHLHFFYLKKKFNIEIIMKNKPKNSFQEASWNFRWNVDMLILLKQNTQLMQWKWEFPEKPLWKWENVFASCVDYQILIWKVAGSSQEQGWSCLKTLLLLHMASGWNVAHIIFLHHPVYQPI